VRIPSLDSLGDERRRFHRWACVNEAAALLTEEKLTKAWGDLTTSFGQWEDFGAETAVVAGEYVVAETRLEFEAGAVTCRSSWSADGKLAGLFFVPVSE
jgi:hypothetical protein